MHRSIMSRILIALFFLTSTSSYAVTVEGVSVPEKITQAQGKQALVLNGAGVRTKFIFSIYVGALYLPEKHHKVDQILALKGANRISMHFLYDEVSKEKLVAGWNDGFEENNSEQEMAKLRDRLNTFNSFFKSVVKGNVILLDYVPGKGTIVVINNQQQGTVPGPDFNRALLKVWLGEEPADDDLKEAMLGKTEVE